MAVTAEPLYLVWHRCAYDGHDHAVTDEQFARVRHEGSVGRYPAVCGHNVLVGSMLQGPGAPCAACRAYVAMRNGALAPVSRPKRTRRRADSLWSRMRRWTRHSTGFATAGGGTR